jgi:site-specific DNA recombinase
MAKPIPVDAYIRVSRIGGREGDRFISPELQKESIERVCAREGLKVVQWFEEVDVSGGDAGRPKWNEVIQRVEQGKSRGVVCWNLSRFSRSVKDALTAIDRIEDAGGKLYSEEGNLGKLDRAIRLAIAEDERDRATAGFRNAVANALARGVYVARRIPFGYLRDPESRKLVPDPEKAPILVALFELRAKGLSWAQLSSWAQKEHGYYFARETIRGMINNVAYLGHARSGELINEKAHEPVVSKLMWDRAQKAKGKRPVHTGAAQNILLRGILTCATCGHNMVVGNTRGAKENGVRQKVPAYYCRNLACKDRAYVKALDLDEYVTHALMEFLDSAEAKLRMKQNDPQERIQAEKDLEEAQFALDQFKANKKAITVLGIDEWNALLEEYVIARDTAQIAVDSLDDQMPTLDSVPELWEEWTMESKREFLQMVISDCSIQPAHRQKMPIEERVDFGLNIVGTGLTVEIRSGQIPQGWTVEVLGEAL